MGAVLVVLESQKAVASTGHGHAAPAAPSKPAAPAPAVASQPAPAPAAARPAAPPPAPRPAPVASRPAAPRPASSGDEEFNFALPDIGEGVAEGEITAWKVAAGDAVREDQPIVEVMTDKATVEIGSPVDGVVAQILAPAGQTIPVGGILCVLRARGGRPATLAVHGHVVPERSPPPRRAQRPQSRPTCISKPSPPWRWPTPACRCARTARAASAPRRRCAALRARPAWSWRSSTAAVPAAASR